MKVSDYIVDFLIKKGVTDVFGYPGGMVTHLMDSFRKKADDIQAHVNYHEQASAFCACGYAQACGITGVAYATSGPGATNLITGICNAYFDSIPTIFITGQVNTFEAKEDLGIRQRGFQETDIVSMVKTVTKYSGYVSKADDIQYELERAWYMANEGRKGPVLLDIPMNVQRSEIEPTTLQRYSAPLLERNLSKESAERIATLLERASRPVILIGAGVKIAQAEQKVRAFARKLNLPTVSSMLAFDALSGDMPNYYGFIGAYGNRAANFLIAKSDLVICLGTRLDIRQVGAVRSNFADQATLVRVDIDESEFSNVVNDNEIQIKGDVVEILDELLVCDMICNDYSSWVEICDTIRTRLIGLDDKLPNLYIQKISKKINDNTIITTDVGQNQVWVAQSYNLKRGQKVLFSGGHGAMGYSLPAAIGAYYGSGKPVVCFCGDGGIQMNIQELQFVARENLPITIFIMNNRALGMIRHFQEMYFDSNYYQTIKEGGYTVPEFSRVAAAYGIAYQHIESLETLESYKYQAVKPEIVEICLENPTYVFPKLEYGKPNQDQEPLLDRSLYRELLAL